MTDVLAVMLGGVKVWENLQSEEGLADILETVLEMEKIRDID